MLAAVNMRPERDAFLRNFAETGETENLETAAIGQNGAVPIHKLMQAAHFPDNIYSRPEVEVVVIGQDHTDIDLFKLAGSNGFNGGLAADRHKDGGFHRAVGSDQPTQTGAAVGRVFNQVKPI